MTELAYALADGTVEECRVRLDSQQVSVQERCCSTAASAPTYHPVRPRDRNAARTRRHAPPAVDRAGGKRSR